MKPSKIFVFHALLFLFSVSVFSQTTPDPGKPDYAGITRDKRIKLIKTDVLREIKSLSKKDQSYQYAELATRLRNTDENEANNYLEQSVQIGLDPATEYADTDEKLGRLLYLLSRVPSKNSVLREKITAEIGKFNVDNSAIEHSKELNETYIRAARQMIGVSGKEKLAFDFAMLSLNGENPAIRSNFSDFLLLIRSKNENLANLYFSKAVESLKNNRDKSLENSFLIFIVKDAYYKNPKTNEQFILPDKQKKEFLEVIISNIQKDVEELKQNKRDNCGSIYAGRTVSEIVKKLQPEKLQLIEDAFAVCRNADISAWRKPDFTKRPLKTTQDYLDFAKEIGDRKIQASYLQTAAHLAIEEKNYPLSFNILDNIEPEFREYNWSYYKLNGTAKLIEDLLAKNDFAAINQLLEKFPREYRPTLIINVINQNPLMKSDRKEFALNLINQARTILKDTDQSLISANDYRKIYEQLTRFYIELKMFNEAIAVNGELVAALNKTVKIPLSKGKLSYPRVSEYMSNVFGYMPQETEFINKNFDQVYGNIGKIKDFQIRFPERYELLAKISQKDSRNYLIPGIPNDVK